jgi:TatD DNase family protein
LPVAGASLVPSLVIDTHCHLTFPDFAGRVPQVLTKAREHGVRGCITISTTTKDCLSALAIAEQHANVWCTAGVHPLYADQGPHEWGNLEKVIRSPKCVAWGELGLDNHYDKPVASVQRAVLDEQLAYIESVHAKGTPKPIVLHCREAFEDLIPVLQRTKLDPTRFVFHCFTGGPAEMRLLLDFGACVSFTGVATYRNAGDVREAIKLVPVDRIMIETDAPFLSPDPHRSVRPCEPWMASLTMQSVAATRGISPVDFEAQINANTKRFFGIEA